MKPLFQRLSVASIVISFFCITISQAQNADTLSVPIRKALIPHNKISWLLYARTIRDNHGNIRFDQNVVSNFKLTNWLQLEAGIRFGETTQKLDSYVHYKIELQTRYFRKTIRVLGRLSDNMVQYTNPNYRRSNYLIVAESKFPLSKFFTLLTAGGYVFSFQQNNSIEGWPVLKQGVKDNYPTFKIGVEYKLNDKGSLQLVCGAYDVFNPYLLSAPFLQSSFDYKLIKNVSLYSYFRYQYNRVFNASMNDFIGLGVKID